MTRNLISGASGAGRGARHLDGGVLGQLVFNNLNQMFIEFVKDDDMTLDTLRARVAAQTRPLARADRHGRPE